MSEFFIGIGQTVQKKVIVITWNSDLKTRNSLSGEYWVLSYEFLPHTFFSVTHGIMLEDSGNCV